MTLRDMVLRRFPEVISPIELRWIAGEEAYLSPMHGRDSVSISVSGELKYDWLGLLEAVDETLRPWARLPHRGKQYSSTRLAHGSSTPSLIDSLRFESKLIRSACSSTITSPRCSGSELAHDCPKPAISCRAIEISSEVAGESAWSLRQMKA